MDDNCTYRIKLHGKVEQYELNTNSPIHMTVAGVDSNTTLINLKTDQSGLIGLLRHLHGRGFVLLSVLREG
jgi:hypothetical protein